MRRSEEEPAKRYAVAEAILEAARKIPMDGVGYTIVVHDKELGQNGGPMAMVTTLPSGRHVRVVIAELMVASVIEDGGSPATAADVCAEDARIVLGVDV